MNTINLMNDIFPIIVRLIISILVFVISYYLIPWLKDHAMYTTIKRYVYAAEKLADAGAITKENKKQYVCNLLIRRNIRVTPHIEALIEAAVEGLDLLCSEVVSAFTEEEDGDDDEDPDPEEDTP